jgi:hypothetical protein
MPFNWATAKRKLEWYVYSKVNWTQNALLILTLRIALRTRMQTIATLSGAIEISSPSPKIARLMVNGLTLVGSGLSRISKDKFSLGYYRLLDCFGIMCLSLVDGKHTPGVWA